MVTTRYLGALAALALVLYSSLALSASDSELLKRAKSCDTSVARAAALRILSDAETADPMEILVAALALYRSGDKDRAVFWALAGRLRMRDALIATPVEGGLFTIYNMAAAPILNHGMHDARRLARTIDEVLTWDASAENPSRSVEKAKEKVAEFEAARAALRHNANVLTQDPAAIEARAREAQPSVIDILGCEK